MKRILIALFFATCILYSSTAQETFHINGIYEKATSYYAFANATIHVDYNAELKNAILLIKEGKIIDVGEKITIPKDAIVIDLKGKHIYPSFIDLYSSYGMPEIKKNTGMPTPQLETATRGAYNWNQAIKPETDAYKLYANDTKAAEELRSLGFGAVLTSQKDGIARGSATLVLVGDEKENNNILKDKAAALYSFNKGTSTQDYPQSLMGSIALLRQTYLDAAWYKSFPIKKEYNISLDAWNQLQTLPQIFEVGDKFSALRADKIADEFNVNYIIKGAGNEYQLINAIKNTNAKYIVPLNFPQPYDVEDPLEANNLSLAEMKHWELAPANAAFLEKSNIDFAFTIADLKSKPDFFKQLQKAIKCGLSEKTALKALTHTPAQLIGMSGKLGCIKKDAIANFLLTSHTIFDKENILFQNWIQGKPYILADINKPDIRGEYLLTIEKQTNTLVIDGTTSKLNGSIKHTTDTTKHIATIALSGNQLTIHFETDSGFIRLAGYADSAQTMQGKGQLPKGEWISWKATLVKKHIPENKPDSVDTSIAELGEIYYPFTAYGKPLLKESLIEKIKTRYDAVLIKNTTIWTNESEGILKNKDVYIVAGKIVRIADNIDANKGAFAKIIDGTGKHLTSGIIDEHSHIALAGGVNEGTQISTAEVRMGDVINSEDINIYRQLAGGVTTSQLLHGSANPIGGQSALIKLRWGKTSEEMKFEKADGFIKFALGENVKQSNWGDNQVIRFPQSRMGVEQVYYDYFYRAKEYQAKWDAYNKLTPKEKTANPQPRRDLDLEAVSEILQNKRFITCHSYVQSEINMLMHVADSFGFKINTFTHILEGYKIADKMKKHGAGASTFADWWAYKMEVTDAIPYNAAILNKMGIVTAINSDDAEMARRLNQEAAKAVKYGNVSEEDAWKMVTLNPAKLLHIDNKVGSVKVGKHADLVLWSDNPLSIYATVEKTLIDGLIYFDKEEDIKLQEEIKKERARITKKMLVEKAGGEPTQKATQKKQKLYHCDTIEETATAE
ncbi:MAG: amidohydrolase family protein [Bacteroidetes bacterium]|nr:amidohydrolase family protein [Bacteroidota bacterium]